MPLHENMKCAKIIEEIIDYLLESGYRKIDTFIDITKKETKIKVVVHIKGKPLKEKFQNEFNCFRDIELEEYGWELSNDIGHANSLDALGTLIDNYEVTEENDQCTIILHRIK